MVFYEYIFFYRFYDNSIENYMRSTRNNVKPVINTIKGLKEKVTAELYLYCDQFFNTHSKNI